MTADNGRGSVPDAAVYIASIAGELSQLAKRHELEALAYLLDMARLEADQVSKRFGDARSHDPGGP